MLSRGITQPHYLTPLIIPTLVNLKDGSGKTPLDLIRTRIDEGRGAGGEARALAMLRQKGARSGT